jgi:PAS domain S-box-containing protein
MHEQMGGVGGYMPEIQVSSGGPNSGWMAEIAQEMSVAIPFVVIDSQQSIVEMRGNLGQYTSLNGGQPMQQGGRFIDLLIPALRERVSECVATAFNTKQSASKEVFYSDSTGALAAVNATVMPCKAKQDCCVVLFKPMLKFNDPSNSNFDMLAPKIIGILAMLTGSALATFQGSLLALSTTEGACVAGSYLLQGSQTQTAMYVFAFVCTVGILSCLPSPQAVKDMKTMNSQLKAKNDSCKSSIGQMMGQIDEQKYEAEGARNELQEVMGKSEWMEEQCMQIEQELQFTENELRVVNTKYADRVRELEAGKADVEDLLGATKIGVLYLDQNLAIIKFTKAMVEIAPFTEADINRSAEQFSYEFTTPMVKACKQVLMQAPDRKREANGEWRQEVAHEGKVYLMRILEHTMPESGAKGLVVTFLDMTERVLQKRDYLRLIEHANAPIFGIDSKGRINEWNKKTAELTHYSKEDVMGRKLVEEFISPEYRTAVKTVLDRALLGEETANFEFPLITKTRTRVEVLLNASSRRNAADEIVGVVGIGQDISGRKETEEKLGRLADELTQLIDTANAPIFGIGVNGEVNEWNKKAAELTGYSKEDVMGRNLVREFITPEYRKDVKGVLDGALAGRVTANFEFPLFTKGGRRLEVLLNANPRRDALGNITGVVGVGQDITDRMAQEQEYIKLIDTANAPIFGIDADGLVNVWNKMASKITGFSNKEVMGRNLVEEFITPDYRKPVKDVFDKALAGSESANFEFPLITKGKKRVEVLLNATSRRDATDAIIGVVGIGQDITERNAQEQEYMRLIDTANAPIFGIDARGCVNVWNNMAEKITGFSTDEVMGHNLVEGFITPDYRTAVKEVLDKALLGEERANFEFPLITKDRKRVEVLLNATSRRDAEDHIIGVVGIGQDITGRKETEAQLTLVANDLTQLIDTANAPIFGIDANGLVNEWNQKAAELTDYQREEVMGRNLVEDFITTEYQRSVKVVFDRALAGIVTANFEFPLFTKGGRRVEVLLNANPRTDALGNITGVVGVGQDITDRIAQEQEYIRLIDSANAPIFGIDTRGLVNVWNNMAATITGFAIDEVMGHNLVEEFITPDYRRAVKQVLDKALSGDEAANFEFPLITKHGTRVEVLLNATSRRDARDNIIGVVGIGQDITGRKETEAQLTLVAKDLTQLIDTANAPIFGIDAAGLVTEWNRKAVEITQFSKQEVMGRNLVQEFIAPDYRWAVKQVLDKALTGKETANFEFPLQTKAGNRVEVLLNATSRRSASGDIIGVVGIGQDITGRKQAEEQLTRVAKDLTQLIDTANAPIFGIDANGLVNEWNQKAATITEYKREEVMGRNLVEEFITQEFRSKVKAVLDSALRGSVTANFEFPLYTKTGRRVEVLLNANPRRDATESIIGVVGVGQDITDRIAQEQEYIRLIDSANAPIFGIDARGLVNVWNKKSVEVTRYHTQDTMGKNLVMEFITPDYRRAVKEVLDRALMGEEAANFEFPLITKDGDRVEVLLNATARRDASGDIIGVVGIGQDITGRKEAEAKLSNMAKDLAQLIDTANAPIFGIDADGHVNEWNQKASTITEYKKQEVMGHNLVEEFITPEYRKAVKDVLDNALQGKVTANFEFPLFTKGGRRLEVLLNANPRRDALGNITGVVGVGQDITDRIAQEQEYVRLIDTANAPIFGIDTRGLVDVWNKMAATITGFDIEEVMGHNLVEEFITPDYRRAVKQVLDKALTGDEAANFEFPLITKGGTRVDVLLNATSRRDATGNIIGVVGIGQDISGRKEVEAKLELVANDLTQLIDTANAPIFGVTSNGLASEWNRKAAEITGFQKEEVLGRNLVEEFITPDFRPLVKQVLEKALRGVETANFEFPLLTKAGARVEVLLNATSRRDATGDIVGMVGIGQDITGRKEAEEQLTRVANDLTQLIDTANAPIFGIDADGNVNEWNQKASQITEYKREEVMGRNLVEEFITPEYRKAVKDVFDQALAGRVTANFEFPLFTKGGRRLEVLLNANPRRDATNNITGVVGVGQDITDRIAQEQEYIKLIDTANAPIFGIDANGNVNVWNKKAASITGFDIEEVMGHNLVEEFITPDYRVPVRGVLDKALSGDEAANFEFPLVTKTGARVEVLLNATSRRDAKGDIVGVVGIGQDITERIAQEEESFRLIKNANAPIFGIDAGGLVTIWNNMAETITGFSTEEVTGHNLVEEFITPDYRNAVKEVLDKALLGEEAANFEFPLMTKNGERVEVLLNATSRRDVTGNITGVVGIGQDITGRKETEAQLTLVANDLTQLIDTANAPIFGIDVNGDVNEWNQKSATITEYSKEEVMGRNLVEEFITPEYRTAVKQVLDKALEGIETANFEFPLVTKRGARVDVLLNATSRRNAKREIKGMVGIGQDITQFLQQQQEFVRLIHNANAPIFGVDSKGMVNIWNRKIAAITGYSEHQVHGRSLVDHFIRPVDKDDVMQVLNNALSGNETDSFELPLVTQNQTLITLLVNASSKRDNVGQVIGVVGVGQDFTARKKMEQARTTFLASFSHELRTPLNGLLGMLELLSELNLPDAAQRYVGLARTSSALLLNLINDILDLSKIEAGQLEIANKPFNLHQSLVGVGEASPLSLFPSS